MFYFIFIQQETERKALLLVKLKAEITCLFLQPLEIIICIWYSINRFFSDKLCIQCPAISSSNL